MHMASYNGHLEVVQALRLAGEGYAMRALLQ